MESHIVRKLGNRTIQDVRNNQISTIPQSEFDRLIPLHSRTPTGRFDPSGPVLRRDALLGEIFPILTGSEAYGDSFLEDEDLGNLASTNLTVLERVLENPQYVASEEARAQFYSVVQNNNLKAAKLYLDKAIISRLLFPRSALRFAIDYAAERNNFDMIKLILSYPSNESLFREEGVYLRPTFKYCVIQNNLEMLRFLWVRGSQDFQELDFAMNEACRRNLVPYIEFLADQAAPLQCNSYLFAGPRKIFLKTVRGVEPGFNPERRVNREAIFWILIKNEDYKCMQILQRIFRHERYQPGLPSMVPGHIKDQLHSMHVYDEIYKCPMLCALTFRRYDVVRYMLSLSVKNDSLLYPYTASILNLSMRMESDSSPQGFSAPFDIITEIYRQALHDITPESLYGDRVNTVFQFPPNTALFERPDFFRLLTPDDFSTFAELLSPPDYRRQPSLLNYSILPNEHGIRVTQFFLDNGANPNYDDSFSTPLTEACYRRELDIVQLLLSRGADPSLARSKFTRTAPWTAPWMSEVIRATPLYYAIKNHSLPIVKALIEGGARASCCIDFKFRLQDQDVIKLKTMDSFNFPAIFAQKGFDINEFTEVLRYLFLKGVNFDTFTKLIEYIDEMFKVSSEIFGKYESGDYSLLDMVGKYYESYDSDGYKEIIPFMSVIDTADDHQYEQKLKYFITMLKFDINYVPENDVSRGSIDARTNWRYNSPLLFYAIAESDAEKVEILLKYKARTKLKARYIQTGDDRFQPEIDADDDDSEIGEVGDGQLVNSLDYAKYWRDYRGKKLTELISQYLQQNDELSADEALQQLREEDDFKEKEYDLRQSNKILFSIEAAFAKE